MVLFYIFGMGGAYVIDSANCLDNTWRHKVCYHQ